MFYRRLEVEGEEQEHAAAVLPPCSLTAMLCYFDIFIVNTFTALLVILICLFRCYYLKTINLYYYFYYYF